jgi:hypothetical protein
VTEATIVQNTPMAIPTARPRMIESPTVNMPNTAMITTPPASSTARPAVSIDRTVAASGSRPSFKPSR